MAKLSLQEQMLKAGLISHKKADKVAKQGKKSRSQSREAKAAVEENKAAQKLQAQELNQQKNEQAQQKAVAAQIKQLIELNKIDRSNGEISYKFSDGATVKSIYVDDFQQKNLANGRLAIVRFADGYELVAAEVARKITLRDESLIVLHNIATQIEPEEDDPYAAFVIPDDLMW